MRVLLAHNFYRSNAPSGEDAVYRNEKQLLQDHGIEVASFEKHNDALGDGALGMLRGSAAMLASPRCYDELTAKIAETQPDLVHLHNGFPQLFSVAAAACRDARVPLVQTLHNYRLLCTNGLLLRDGAACERCIGHSLYGSIAHGCYRDSKAATAMMALATQRQRRAMARGVMPTRFIALTEAARGRFIRGGVPAERLVVRGNALPADPGISTGDEGYMLYVGRLTREKGVHTLIKAWRRHTPMPLRLVGDGVLRAELAAASVGLPIEFLGQRSHAETLELLRAASVLILPSECYEGFPMAVVEALATGTPMILSDILSVSDMLDEPGNALKFPAGDFAALAAAATRLASDEMLRRRMARNNRALYEQHYTPARSFESLRRIYVDVLGAAPEA